MQSPRLLAAVFVASASTLWAQLPPSSLNSGRPAQPVPQPPAVRPTVPPVPGVPVAPPAVQPAPAPPTMFGVPAGPNAPAAVPEPAALPSVPDLSNTVPNTLTAEETAQGWKLLFDGTRLLGWRGVQKADPISAGWKIQNGELVLPKDIKEMDRITGGDLATVEQFWDFEFRFEWKATVSANSGIRYMVNTAMGQPPTGLEYQIIDDVHSSLGLKGGPIRRSSALDNIIPPGPNARLRSADPLQKREEPWNEGRIVVQGTKVEHWLNGEKVLEFALGPQLRTIAEKNYNREELFAQRPHVMFGTKGRTPIVILDQGTEVAFRNLKVRPIAPQAVAPAGKPAAAAPGVGQRTPVPNPFLIQPRPTGSR